METPMSSENRWLRPVQTRNDIIYDVYHTAFPTVAAP
jgi:hypothetical protein